MNLSQIFQARNILCFKLSKLCFSQEKIEICEHHHLPIESSSAQFNKLNFLQLLITYIVCKALLWQRNLFINEMILLMRLSSKWLIVKFDFMYNLLSYVYKQHNSPLNFKKNLRNISTMVVVVCKNFIGIFQFNLISLNGNVFILNALSTWMLFKIS